MGNDIARDVHCGMEMGKYFAIDVHYDITMSNDVYMCI